MPSLAGPEAPAGPRRAERGAEVFRSALRDYVPSDGDQADAQDEAVAESYPGLRPARERQPGHARPRRAVELPQLPEGGTATAAAAQRHGAER